MLPMAATVVALVSGCGGAPAKTITVGEKPFHPHPYTPGCVSASFAKAGIGLFSVFPGSGAKRGFVILASTTNVYRLQVLVAGNPQIAGLELAQVRTIKRLHPGTNEGSAATRSGNLYVSYRNDLRDREIVGRGLRLVAQRC